MELTKKEKTEDYVSTFKKCVIVPFGIMIAIMLIATIFDLELNSNNFSEIYHVICPLIFVFSLYFWIFTGIECIINAYRSIGAIWISSFVILFLYGPSFLNGFVSGFSHTNDKWPDLLWRYPIVSILILVIVSLIIILAMIYFVIIMIPISLTFVTIYGVIKILVKGYQTFDNFVVNHIKIS